MVKSGTQILSTGNETSNLCQSNDLGIDAPMKDITVSMPAKSLSTFVFMIDNDPTAISSVNVAADDGPKTYYDLSGRRLDRPQGICIERRADGTCTKVYHKER